MPLLNTKNVIPNTDDRRVTTPFGDGRDASDVGLESMTPKHDQNMPLHTLQTQKCRHDDRQCRVKPAQ